jgi:predicted carbohydrate-binding protein with CBM5 and CBM33 domain
MNPTILTFADFRNFVISLINTIIDRVDKKAAEQQVKLDKLSADLTAANETIVSLNAALAAKEQEKAAELAALAASQIGDLDQFSTELAEQFNPTPGKDAAAEVVIDEPEIVTPPIVEESSEVGTGEATPSEVSDAAVEAIADAADELIDG